MSLKSKLNVNFSSTQTVSGDLSNPQDPVAETFTAALANGVLANQADLHFHDIRTLAGGATEDLDLKALTDKFGGAVNFARIKALVFVNLSATKVFTIGNAASNAWAALLGATGTLTIPPGGAFAVAAPDATALVTGASLKALKIANNAGDAANYKIWIVGASA